MKTSSKIKCFGIFILSCLCFNLSRAQKYTHILVYECPVYSCNINGGNISSSYIIAPEGSRLDSIRLNEGGDVIVTFGKWTPPEKTDDTAFVAMQLQKIDAFNYELNAPNTEGKIAEAKNKLENETPQKYFIIKSGDFKSLTESLAKRKKWDVTAGALIIPFKVRSKPFDFSKDITLAGTGAWGYKFTKDFTLFFTTSLGISSIAIDSVNTNGKTTKPTNLSAFTISPGLVLAWQKLHVSFNYGWDHLSNADKSVGWIYNTHGWIGIGIGYQLFSPEGGKESKKKDSDEKQK
jgi:hypothetical protein